MIKNQHKDVEDAIKLLKEHQPQKKEKSSNNSQGPLNQSKEEQEQLICELITKNEELTNMLKCLQAEFENYKKRTDRETEQKQELSNLKLISSLLPLLDSFESAITQINFRISESESPKEQNTKEQDTKKQDSTLSGMKLIYTQLKTLLEKEGLKRIIVADKRFDPYYHEVLMQESRPEIDDEVIIHELSPGYTFKGSLLRTSKVCINKK